ncbi:hypothetical protein ASE67_02510 [Sphingomonas sp. Leaf23]|nr:hypothetical protein ASE67_02510 [Sphingomonas sp. Leaf23]
MDAVGLNQRGAQARMMELTGWSKATMNQLYNGKQNFNPEILETAAVALHVEPFELLIPPERAMALRSFRDTAALVAKSVPAVDKSIDMKPNVERTGTDG